MMYAGQADNQALTYSRLQWWIDYMGLDTSYIWYIFPMYIMSDGTSGYRRTWYSPLCKCAETVYSIMLPLNGQALMTLTLLSQLLLILQCCLGTIFRPVECLTTCFHPWTLRMVYAFYLCSLNSHIYVSLLHWIVRLYQFSEWENRFPSQIIHE